jgi:hypothetical protein
MCVQTAKPCVEPQNDVDIEMEISKLKNGKAAGFDQVPGELILTGRKRVHYHEHITKRWEERRDHTT